jgi:hypothetical protein
LIADDIKKQNQDNVKITNMSPEEIDEIHSRGDALVMENDACLAEYLYADDLKKMIVDSNTNLDFVFMATCHSQFAAEIF